MSSLPSQKYPNNIRTVSGTVTLYTDDVVLNCDTSSAAVNITLFDIPASKWMTTYTLYVIDSGNNAATNNITISAPNGFYINAASSVTINTNGGAVLIKILNNTNYIATYNSIVSASSTPSYLYTSKLLQTAGTYVSQAGVNTRSVFNGIAMTGYDSKVESGITGFNITTGVWTVPSNGYYSVNAKLTTRLLDSDIDSNVDNVGGKWVTLAPIDGGQGYISIGIICRRGTNQYIVCANKQILSDNISDVNIECSSLGFNFQAGDVVSIRVLNKTNHDIVGIAAYNGLPDCYTDFSVKK